MSHSSDSLASRLNDAHDLLVSEFEKRKASASADGEALLAREWQEEIDAADKQMQALTDDVAAVSVIDEWLGRYANLSGN